MMCHLPPDATNFASLNGVSGYHQMNLAKESCDLLSIITQYSKYQYTTVAQVVCPAIDLFNMVTDGDVKLAEDSHILKNMDDFFLYGSSIEPLEE